MQRAPGFAVGGSVAKAQVVVNGEVHHSEPNQIGYFKRVYVPPSSKIRVEVSLPDPMGGDWVIAEAEDGGAIDGVAMAKAFQLPKSRKVAFTFHATDNAGVHRVSLRHGAQVRVLDFWVGPPLAMGAMNGLQDERRE